jgi:hypothetical protein
MKNNRVPIKTHASLIVAALLASTITGCSKHPATATSTPQTARFTGFTNGNAGGIASVFARLGPRQAANIQQWLANGTNAAMFTITNHQSCEILIQPFGRILNAGANPTNDETPILNAPPLPGSSAPAFSGIRLKPGQVTNLQIADIGHAAPWRVRFFYMRIDQNLGFAGLLQRLRSLILRTPNRVHVYTIDSNLLSE